MHGNVDGVCSLAGKVYAYRATDEGYQVTLLGVGAVDLTPELRAAIEADIAHQAAKREEEQ